MNEELRQRIARLSPEKRALLELRLMQQHITPARQETIPRRHSTAPCELSFAQQRLWFLMQLDPQSAAYNEAMTLRLRGLVDIAALQQALDAVVERHEALRTTFVVEHDRPFQVIGAPRAVACPVIDLRAHPEEGRETACLRILQDEIQRPFDLRCDLMLRALLVRLHDEEQVLLILTHHIASDGWSTSILLRELSAVYTAGLTGQPIQLQALPMQYADYALWQRQWLRGDMLETQLAYWRQQLAGAPAALDLPTDRPYPAVQSQRGAERIRLLPARLTEALKLLGQQEGCTLFMVVLAAWQTLLCRFTGQHDIVVGSPIAGRTRRETEGLIGFFVNTLVLRTDMRGNPSFRALLARVRDVALGAYTHQDVPFEKLVEELRPQRDPRHHPLFQVMCAFQNAPKNPLSLPGVIASPLRVPSGMTKFDLSMTVTETDQGLQTSMVYCTELFEAATIERWLGHWQVLLEHIAADPAGQVETLPLLTEAERQQVVVDWNRTAAAAPQRHCVHTLFAAQVARTPEAMALRYENEQLTYRELDRRANRVAHRLQALGVAPEVLVGIYMQRSLDMIVALLAVLKAGGGYVPLEPATPRARLAMILQDSQPAVLLTQPHLLADLPEQAAHVLCLESCDTPAPCEADVPPVSAVTAENVAYVIYTSGTTGTPKGVVVPHGAVAQYVETAGTMFDLVPHDRVLQFASIAFDAAVEEIFPCLTRGATLIVRTEAMLATVPTFLQTCQAWGVTVLDLPTAYWHELVAQLGELAIRFPASIRLVIIGGEKALWERLVTWHHSTGGQVRLINTYGPTETTVVATMGQISTCAARHDAMPHVPLGRPIPHVQAYVFDDHLQPVPVGVAGELYLGGVGVARGYLGRSGLTAERFMPHPCGDEPGGRLYRTGDLVRYRSHGVLEFLRRRDRQVKVRGFRIELGDIEAVLHRHPSLRAAVVQAHTDDRGDTHLVSYVVPLQHGGPAADDLRHYLREHLPAYMVPQTFVSLQALPLTPGGKVDRAALPAPAGAASAEKETFVAPRTQVETVLAGMWASVLGIERLGVHDDFFALGGHSLLITQVLYRVQRELRVQLSLRDFFEASTVAELARRVVAREASPGQSARIARIVLQAERMSAEEVRQTLQEKRQG